MSILAALGTLIAPITGITNTVLEAKSRKDERTAAAHSKELEFINNLTMEEMKTQRESTKGLSDTLKDEYVLVLLSIPCVLAFCGSDGAQIVTDGFTALATTPDWYQWMLVAVFSTAAGVPLVGRTVDVVNKIRGK